jgi:hypothetical protein
MFPPIDFDADLPRLHDAPVLLWICPTEEGSLDSVPIPVPVVGRLPQGCDRRLSPDPALVPYIVPLFPEFSQRQDLDPHSFRAVNFPMPRDPSPVMTVMTQIDFKTGIAIKDSKARSASGRS